jgi:quinol monooxygenase YgiN
VATILAHITVKPGQETEFEGIAQTLFRSSHDQEAGLLRYEYWRGQDVGSYYTLLSFRSYADFISHQISPHHEQAASRLGDVIANLRLEWLDPLVGASDLPCAQSAQLEDSPDPLVRRAARMFPVQLGSWWPSAGQAPVSYRT